MKWARLLVALILAILVFAATAHTQDTSKKTAQLLPAPGPSEAVLLQWNEIGRKLIAMAEDFPEAKLDFKPKPGARTFAERLIHAAAANYYFIVWANGRSVFNNASRSGWAI